MGDKDFIFCIHTLSYVSEVNNDHVTLTFMLKIAFSDSLASEGQVFDDGKFKNSSVQEM